MGSEYEELQKLLAELRGTPIRAITHALKVSPNGNGTDGLSWPTAYTTIPNALNAASTDPGDCTLIQISPHATHYDIDTTGNPTWSGNYILLGSSRQWPKIKNGTVKLLLVILLHLRSFIVTQNAQSIARFNILQTHTLIRILSYNYVRWGGRRTDNIT